MMIIFKKGLKLDLNVNLSLWSADFDIGLLLI